MRGPFFLDGSSVFTVCRVPVFRLGDSREHIRKVCGDAVFEQSGPIWGFDTEGELNGVWRDLGVKGLWSMLGVPPSPILHSDLVEWSAGSSMMLSRFYSKHVALRRSFSSWPLCLVFERSSRTYAEIKAMEEGVFGGRYNLVKN